MSEKEIRKANRRALPGFFLFLFVCVAVGGGIGYLFGKYRLDTLAGGLKRVFRRADCALAAAGAGRDRAGRRGSGVQGREKAPERVGRRG